MVVILLTIWQGLNIARQMNEDMFRYWAPDLSSTLLMAERMVDRKNPDITVISDGVSVIVQSV